MVYTSSCPETKRAFIIVCPSGKGVSAMMMNAAEARREHKCICGNHFVFPARKANATMCMAGGAR